MLSKPQQIPQRLYDFPSPSFVPTKLVGLAIFNEKYEETPYPNLKQVRDDAEKVQKLFKRLGIKSEDTTVLFDVKFIDLELLVNKLKEKYLLADKNNVNTLFFIWYGGHGVLHRTSTRMVLNEKDPEKRYYPLELHLNHFSNFSNTYTFVFQDSCRLLLQVEDLELLQKIRGLGCEEAAK